MQLLTCDCRMGRQALLVVLAVGAVLNLAGSLMAQVMHAPAAQSFPSGIVQTQRITEKDSKPKRPLPYPIRMMPEEQEELQIIHRRSQLVITRQAVSRIAIADPNILDVVQYSPTEMGIIGLAMGTTDLHLWFEGSAEPLIYLVEVIRDPSFEERLRMDFGKLEKQLQILFPHSQVYLIPLQQRLVVKGQARDPEEAARILQIVRSAIFTEFGAYGAAYGGYGNGYGDSNGSNRNNNDDDDDDDFIVNMLEVPGNHTIMLHVYIAELSRAQSRELGVNLRAVLNDGRHIIQTTMSSAAAAAGGAGGGAGGGAAAGAVAGVFENGEVSILLKWLAGNRTAKILAAPTLTVLSGHTASFLSGGEFPVPTIVGVGGAQGTTTSFRGFGTSLLASPEVIDKDWVSLDITAEYSQLNQAAGGGGGTPGLNSRRVQTFVRLREGQTIVLAGLYGATMTSEVDRIPFLGELPVIGPTLFNAKKADQGENELLIMVTPELVRPMEPDEVPPLPGFEVTPPNDLELYAYAKTEGYPDQGVYQLNPYGWGPGHATEIGYRPFNPASYNHPSPLNGAGYGAMTTGYPVQQPGYLPPQPAAVYPGPPAAQTMPAMQYAPPQAVPAGPVAPVPDPAMSGAGPGVQQMSYQQPQRAGLTNWFRREPAPAVQHPAPAGNYSNQPTPPAETGGWSGRYGRPQPVAAPAGYRW